MADSNINEVSNVGGRSEVVVDASQFQAGRAVMDHALNNTMSVGGGADDFPVVDLTDDESGGTGGGGGSGMDNRDSRGSAGHNEQFDDNRLHEQMHDGAQNEAPTVNSDEVTRESEQQRQQGGNGGDNEPKDNKFDPMKKKPLPDKNPAGAEGQGGGGNSTSTTEGTSGTGSSDGRTPAPRIIIPAPAGGSSTVETGGGGSTRPVGIPPVKESSGAGE